MYNKEPILLNENGYKLLNKEVRAKLRSSVGTLLSIQLRSKVEKSIKEFEDMIIGVVRYPEYLENLVLSGKDIEPSVEVKVETPKVQPLVSSPSKNAIKSKKDVVVVEEPSMFPTINRYSRTISSAFDFIELKKAVEGSTVFFLNINFNTPRFLRHQRDFLPFLQLDMIIENDIIKYSDTEDSLRLMFSKMHSDIIDSFSDFPHPEFISIQLVQDPLDEHPKENYPGTSDRNYDNFYKCFLPYIQMKEKKRKRKVQSILETAHIDEVDEKSKYLNVNDSSERQYVESCEKIVERIVNHYNDSKIAFSIFDQFKLFFDKSIDRSVKSFLDDDHKLVLDDLRRNLVMVRSFKTLLNDVPDEIYFPLFKVKTDQVKDHLLKTITEFEKLMIEKIRNNIEKEMEDIKKTYDNLKVEMTKDIKTAQEFEKMEKFMLELSQIRINLRNKSTEVFRKILYVAKLGIAEMDTYNHAKDLYECPTRLEENITKANDKHHNFKLDISNRLDTQKEEFDVMSGKMQDEMDKLSGMTDYTQFEQFIEKFRDFNSKLVKLEKEMIDIMDQEKKLFSKSTEYKEVPFMRERINPVLDLWESINSFMTKKSQMMECRVIDIEMREVDDLLQDARVSFTRISKSFGKHSDERKVIEEYQSQIESFKSNYQKIEVVCNKGLSDRHWDKIKQILGNNFNFKEDKLSELLTEEVDLGSHFEEISEISRQASTEYKLYQMLDKIEKEWSEKNFELLNWKNTELLVFSGTNFEEIQILLDDNVLKTQTIRSDPAVKFMEAKAIQWEELLVFLQRVCDIWIKAQQSFIYLVPVFNSEDIRTHLPAENSEFKKIQLIWDDLMRRVYDEPKATNIKNIPDLVSNLKNAQKTMDTILKSLNNYLDMKRNKFPRFYFLSNEEMLNILSETKDPQLVQPHLKKCFEGINELIFNMENEIVGMKSEMGEKIEFDEKIIPKNYKSAVEDWLVKIEEQMRISMKSKIEDSLVDLSKNKGSRWDWIKAWPGQCALICSQITWTFLVEDKIKMLKTIKDLKEELNNLLKEIVIMVRGDLTNVERVTLGALITLEVHGIDIINELILQRCHNPTDFEWLSQLRYYFQSENDKNVQVEMVVTKLNYGFEYLGNTSRLVITPLTDRCYRTLMSALFLNLGGAPEGPAGTGKTETTKDLAKAMAILWVVHNWTGSINAKSMAKFFKGLVSTGAWSCFDEFNRIQLEVLSVVAQQIHQIQTAKSQKLNEFTFDGSILKMVETCNIFITMNPGYAGRSELPDNLKSLFRPVAMMVPDYATIAEISLYSVGFIEARKLSKKIVATYKLCSEQLSSQYHYDYGMRAVKAVLTTAGMLKRLYLETPEEEIIMKSINDVNLPKFVNQDIKIFKSILKDLFPSMTMDEKRDSKMDENMTDALKERFLSTNKDFKQKVYQLYDMIQTRHGLMLVGD